MNRSFIKHGHNLANKVFGDEDGKRQDLCADQLHHLQREDTHRPQRLAGMKAVIQFKDWFKCGQSVRFLPQRQWLHSSGTPGWTHCLVVCCKTTETEMQ